jgi:hypothetical protein
MALFESLGYLVSRNDTTTIIAAERNDEDEYRDITLILNGSVISIHRLVASSPVQVVVFFLCENTKVSWVIILWIAVFVVYL